MIIVAENQHILRRKQGCSHVKLGYVPTYSLLVMYDHALKFLMHSISWMDLFCHEHFRKWFESVKSLAFSPHKRTITDQF